jgi:hypothetical protein
VKFKIILVIHHSLLFAKGLTKSLIGDWDYKAALENWVDSGMKVKDTHFIDMVSRVFKSGICLFQKKRN